MVQEKNNKKVTITVDMNDADIQETSWFATDKELDILTRIGKAISEFKPPKNIYYNNFNVVEGPRCKSDDGRTVYDLYVPAVTEEELDWFIDQLPRDAADYGCHTVVHMVIEEVINTTRLV